MLINNKKYLKFFFLISLVHSSKILSIKNIKKSLISSINSFPISGFTQNKYKPFDHAVTKFMKKRGFKGATLSIAYKNKIIVNRGYGWQDKKLKKAINPNIKMRIASLSKILTKIAIYQLINKNKITLNSLAFSILSSYKNIKDNRVNSITVLNLLNHSGGWNQNITNDPLFYTNLIAVNNNKKPTNLTPKDIIQYAITNKSLSFTPGQKKVYSNLGYLILGEIIEKASGLPYLKYIQKNICDPLKIKITVATNNPDPNLWYFSHDIDPNSDLFNLKASASTFGLKASSFDICKLLNNYWITGKKREENQIKQLFKDGSLPGVTSLARQRFSGVSIVVLINSRDNNNWKSDNFELKNLIDNTANRCSL